MSVNTRIDENEMPSELAVSLLEQHALIALHLNRSASSGPYGPASTFQHLMRATYAHLSVVRKIVLPAIAPYAEAEQMGLAADVVAGALAAIALAGVDRQDGATVLHDAMAALVLAERNLLTLLARQPDDGARRRLAMQVEDHFETLYGRHRTAEELQAEQRPTLD